MASGSPNLKGFWDSQFFWHRRGGGKKLRITLLYNYWVWTLPVSQPWRAQWVSVRYCISISDPPWGKQLHYQNAFQHLIRRHGAQMRLHKLPRCVSNRSPVSWKHIPGDDRDRRLERRRGSEREKPDWKVELLLMSLLSSTLCWAVLRNVLEDIYWVPSPWICSVCYSTVKHLNEQPIMGRIKLFKIEKKHCDVRQVENGKPEETSPKWLP